MNIKINLIMDSRWFWIILAILIIVLVYMLNYGNMNISLITVQQYQNCTVPDYLRYQPYWESTGIYTIQEHKECCYPTECYENIEDMPQDCDCIYPVACGTLEELGLG